MAESWQVVAALLLGGVVSAGTHAAKMGSRAIINTSPEPFSNWFASIFEDVIVVIGLLLALFSPTVFLIWMVMFGLFLMWVLPKLWRGLKTLWQRIQGFQEDRKSGGTGNAIARAFAGAPPASGQSEPQPPATRP